MATLLPTQTPLNTWQPATWEEFELRMIQPVAFAIAPDFSIRRIRES